jgi:rhodanese-related sulfurtransferase
VHIGLTGQFASWAARILGLDARIVVSAEDPEAVRESQTRLARVGIENVAGYVDGGLAGWIRGSHAAEYIPQIAAQDLAQMMASEPLTILDVREPGEVAEGAIAGSIRIPLALLQESAGALDRGRLLVTHCKGGYRSSIATSLLRRAGFHDIANLTGGFDAWKASGLPVSAAAAG